MEKSFEKLISIGKEYESKVSVIDADAERKKAEYRAQRTLETGRLLYRLDEHKQAAALALLGAAVEAVGYLEAQKLHQYMDNVVRRHVVLGGADAARVLNSRSGATDISQQEQSPE
ncbi:MAG: hypothetical protein Kow001_02800 [Acidobacteriota bacterium]